MGASFDMVEAGMNIHQLPVKDALKGLRSTANGLSSVAALQRLRDFGPNCMEKVAGMPPVLRLLKEFVQFFSVILWIAAALAFVAEWSAPGQGMARIGFAIITVILVSGAFSFWQEHRVEQTLEALQKLLPPQVNLLRDGSLVRLGVDQLVPGDLVLLEQGDIVPADCRLIEAFGVRVNNATVTGESMALAREPAPSGEDDLIRSKNILLAGTSVVSGQATALVFATGSRTEFGKIAHLAQTSGAAVSPLRRQLAYLSRLIASLAVGIGLSFFAIGAAIGVPFWQDFIFSNRHYRRDGARGAPSHFDALARPRGRAHGQAQCSDPSLGIGGDAGLRDCDLHRQDRDPDRKSHAGARASARPGQIFGLYRR